MSMQLVIHPHDSSADHYTDNPLPLQTNMHAWLRKIACIIEIASQHQKNNGEYNISQSQTSCTQLTSNQISRRHHTQAYQKVLLG